MLEKDQKGPNFIEFYKTGDSQNLEDESAGSRGATMGKGDTQGIEAGSPKSRLWSRNTRIGVLCRGRVTR
jgi:hypothetical protein